MWEMYCVVTLGYKRCTVADTLIYIFPYGVCKPVTRVNVSQLLLFQILRGDGLPCHVFDPPKRGMV